MSSTISLRSIVDFNRTRTRMIQMTNVGGIPNQPALGICNDVLQTLLSAPNNWKFNKAEVPTFTTIPNQQDYWLSGCTAAVLRSPRNPRAKAIVSLNSALGDPPGLEQQGNTVIARYDRFAPDGIRGKGTAFLPARFAWGDEVVIHGAGIDAYNGRHIITDAWHTGFTYEICETGLGPSGGQGVNSIAWLEHANIEDWFSTAWVKPNREILVVSGLPTESIIQPPFKVCLQVENMQTCGNTSITEVLIRFWPVPSSQVWRVLLFYQKKAPLKVDLEDNWSPWPDELAYVLRSGVYAKALEHGEDPRSPNASMMWQQDIARALGIRQQEERHEAFFVDLPILRGG